MDHPTASLAGCSFSDVHAPSAVRFRDCWEDLPAQSVASQALRPWRLYAPQLVFPAFYAYPQQRPFASFQGDPSSLDLMVFHCRLSLAVPQVPCSPLWMKEMQHLSLPESFFLLQRARSERVLCVVYGVCVYVYVYVYVCVCV